MYVVFLHGPPAAGKHTIGTLLAARLAIPLFHNHLTVDLAKSLFAFGTPGFVALRAAVWREAFATAARERRSFVFTFNPEATVEPTTIAQLAASVEAVGGHVYYVELQCADEVVEQRIELPSRARFGKVNDVGLYRQIRADGGFAFPPLPPALICIDTASTSPLDATERIARALAAA
jgi:hypothetical protein